MKKLHLITITIVLSGFLGLLICGIFYRIGQNSNEIEKFLTLPGFNSHYIDGRTFNSDKISQGPVLIVFFHPECEHCQYEIGELSKFLSDMPGVNILLISHAPTALVKEFAEDYGIMDSGLSAILSDDSLYVRDLFKVKIVPTTIIYNKRLELVRRFDGEVKIETVMRYLKSYD